MGLAYQALQQQQPQQAQPEEPLWDTSDPQKLKGQIEDSLRKTVVDTLSPVVTHFSGNQFESNLSILKGDARFPYAAKWENEIRQLAQQVPAALLGKPETVSGLYSLVASRHQQELVEEEVQKRMTAQQQPTEPDDGGVEVDDGEEEDEEEKEKPNQPVPQRQPEPQRQPQQVARPQSTQPSRSVRAPQQKLRLTREEAYMAEQMGMSHKEYALAKNLGDAEI
jgi:hypothetical protein